MKPRNREINIFNLSMLDVICGSMGAFLIIMVILLPYYKKEKIDYQQELKQSRDAEESSRKALHVAEEARSAAQADAENSRKRADAATQQLAKTFLLVHIQWGTKLQDIDLHVVDPTGTEYYYKHKSYPGKMGTLSVDSQFGPGNEVWNSPNASPGDYQVYANLYDAHGVDDTPTISGSVIHRDGSTVLPPTQLTAKQKKYLVATVRVGSDGGVSLQ